MDTSKNERIFISYKRVDKDRVFELKNEIEQSTGEKCWIDLDGIESDAQFADVIIKAINRADVFLFMYSIEHTKITDFENDWTIKEITFAKEKKKRIVIINIDDTPLIDQFLFEFPRKQRIDASDTSALARLYKDICSWLKINIRQIQHDSSNNTSKAEQYSLRKGKELQERIVQAEAAKKVIAEQHLAEQKMRKAEEKSQQTEEQLKQIEMRRKVEEARKTEEARRQEELQKQRQLEEERRLQEEKERKEAEKVARMQEEQRRIREQEELKRKEKGKLIKVIVGVVGGICCIIGIIFWLNPALMIQDPNKLYDKGWNKARMIGTVKGADKDAFQFYRKAAKKGHPAAMNRLALFYMDGVGTKQNIDEAIKWFEEAIEAGNMEAALNLGYLYETGNGVEKDLSQAIKYYKKSAEGGMVRAQLKLGNCYKTGTCGVSQDLKEALKWYQKAADQGNEEAQNLVASLSKKSNSSTKKTSSSNSTKVQVKKEDNTQQTTNHELKIYVTPANAVVKVVVEGKEESWSVVNGCATKKIPHGTYYCTVSADGYYPYEKHITFTSSDNSVHINLVKKRSSTSSSSSYTSSNSSSSSSKTSNSLPAKAMHNGHEYIDLGLSVKWATCNLGANDAENYGNHYGWGGDAARTNWGGNWRMPTDMEWIELRNSCTWSWTKKNGVGGYLVKSRKNSNTIFLPAAGYSMKGSSGCYSLGAHGYYWSSTMDKNNQNFALGVQFDSADKAFSRSLDRKNLFCSIRPVFP